MLNKSSDGDKTKRGAVSLYVVIFTTLVLGVITLSFIQIIISEVNQTSNSDLAQSAYDSALAGVEDAKMALLKYHDCISGRATSGCTGTSGIITKMEQGIKNESCDVVKNVLNRAGNTSEGKAEVLVQETSSSTSKDLLQAYTCVKISEELADYRTTLTSNYRTVLIPLRTNISTMGSGEEADLGLRQVDTIKIRWYSLHDFIGNQTVEPMTTNEGLVEQNIYAFPSAGEMPYAPPVISVEFIQTGGSFNPSEDFEVPTGNEKTNRAEAFLLPISNSNKGTNNINSAQFTSSANKTPDSSSQRAYYINCNGLKRQANGAITQSNEFACETKIGLPSPAHGSRNQGTTFLRVTLPYGTPMTDIAVEMLRENSASTSNDDTHVNFKGVQAQVDSTGRANDIYRRVETRVELVDVYQVYPEFSIEADGNDNNDALTKNFYITKNCWSSDDAGAVPCSNNGSL